MADPAACRLNRRHPDIDINVRAGQALADFTAEDVDLAVRYGSGKWPGLNAVQLADEDVFPVCSPRFNGGRLPKTLDELAKARLLHTPLQPWDEWFRALDMTATPSRRGMTFSETDLLLRAAIDGLGVALSRRILAQPELDAGRLRTAGAAECPRRPFVLHRVSRSGRTAAASVDLPGLAVGTSAFRVIANSVIGVDMPRARLRELGIVTGTLPPGQWNAITDVPGVRVGYTTLIRDTPSVVRTGVTAIWPRSGAVDRCGVRRHPLVQRQWRDDRVGVDSGTRPAGVAHLHNQHTLGRRRA